MKKNFHLMTTILAVLVLGESGRAAINANDLCTINGTPAIFKITSWSSGGLIVRGETQANEQASLSYSLNSFYGIGGRVTLNTASGSVTLLNWGSEYFPSVLHSVVEHKGLRIECKAP